MAFFALTCPSCGAPLPPSARRVTVICAYCQATVAWEQSLVKSAKYREALRQAASAPGGPSTLTVSGVVYRVFGAVACGESSDVYWAERVRRPVERVLIKVLREERDDDLWQREERALLRLANSNALGAEYFGTLVPRTTLAGEGNTSEASPRKARVLRFASGFVHTLDDVARAYPQGLDARHAVWIWRRLLEVLDFVHRSGLVHGAVLPQHVLVHARDHGIRLVGFSCAGAPHEELPVLCASRTAFYPHDARAGSLSPASDVIMSARCVRHLLGVQESSLLPTSIPAPLATLLSEIAAGRGDEDAAQVHARLGGAARESFGPSRFVPLVMPGWG